MGRRLYRSKTDRKVAGVCGGIAEFVNIDPTLVRLGVAFVTVVTAVIPGFLFYFAAAIIMPEDPN